MGGPNALVEFSLRPEIPTFGNEQRSQEEQMRPRYLHLGGVVTVHHEEPGKADWEKSWVRKVVKVALALIPPLPEVKDMRKFLWIHGTIMGGTLALGFFLEPRSRG